MPLLLHAITPKLDRAPTLAGLRGYGLRRITDEDLCAWLTPLPNDAESFTREDLWDDHRVVSEVFARVEACLPARFPTWVPDEAAMRTLLETQRTSLVDRLKRVKGCCELALTAVWTAAEETPPRVEADTPGRKYLLERRAALVGSDRRHARALELAEALDGLVGGDLVEEQRRLCPSATIALSSALLVKRSGAENLKTRLARAERDVRILVHGPWPPYTFAAIGSR